MHCRADVTAERQPERGDVRAAIRGAKMKTMASTPERPISDPLLRPDFGPRDATGTPIRAPLGNSIKTLLALCALVAVGVGVWWLQRPDDLSTRIGGREWVITAIDGEPATNETGVASTFVLDGTGEIRAPLGCNAATGTWSYDPGESQLDISWATQTQLGCPDDWPTTYLPVSGSVSLDGSALRVRSDDRDMRAISPTDAVPVAPTDAAGEWSSGDHIVEIGRRGLFVVDTCRGSWSRTDDDLGLAVSFDGTQRDDCSLASFWAEADPFLAIEDGSSIYLWRDRSMYPFDRGIVRLDPVVSQIGSPLTP